MGTVCAPSYANLFMAPVYLKDMSLLYLRYIDDIFIIWKGTKEPLITFINELNEKYKTIRSESEIHSRKSHSYIQWYIKIKK